MTARATQLPRRSLRLAVLGVLATVLFTVVAARAHTTAVPPTSAAAGAPGIMPQQQSFPIALSDDAPWEQRAIWWNPSWRYRIPVDLTAAATLTDAVVNFSVDWTSVLAATGATAPLDPASLRMVEYTPGGHIVPSYGARHTGDLGCNRFDRVPVAVRGSNPNGLWALVPNTTVAGNPRRFFLYFDTTDNPKPAKDYHYLTVAESGDGLRIERTGPETECNFRALATVFAKGSPSGISAVTGVGARFLYPSLSGSGACSGDLVTAASYSPGNTVPAVDMGAVFTGPTGSCGSISGSGNLTVGMLTLGTSMGAVVQGSITLAPAADIQVQAGQTLTLAGATTATASSDAWYSGSNGVVHTFTGPAAGFTGAGQQIGTRAGTTTVIQIDEASVPAAFGGGVGLQALRPDRTSISVAAPSSGGVWRSGEPLTVRFTLLWAATTLDAAALSAQLASAFAAGNVRLGSPGVYSEDLLEAQFRYYENKGWDYVQGTLATHGWGQPWNITYAFDLDTQQFEQAHHNDSSMGAGFILYAASLKAAMTGEQRYYDMANVYADYFLHLEAEDIAQHGPGVAGRISYGYNGGDAPIMFGPCMAPPRGVPDCTSIDQMTTSGLGLWQYANLDPGKAALHGPVRELLGRMAGYAAKGGPNLAPSAEFQNLRPLLGLGGSWTGVPSNFPPQGFLYAKWLAHLTTDLNTGSSANNFFIVAFLDRILPRKLPAQLVARYGGVVKDTGTATRGYYPIVRGVSYQSAWGWDDWEFPTVGMLNSTVRGLVWREGDPPNYQLLNGGTRDSLSGRMAQQASVVMWAALEEPEGRMEVAGAPGPAFIEYARNAIHAMIALLMHDSGGIRDGALGVMGRASAVNDAVLTADFSGYYLLLMAQYRLWRGETSNPMPANRHDYVQGIAERDGVTTITYLGDQQFLQRFAFPNNGWPVLNTGVIPTPTLTYQPDGTAAEFFGTTLFLPVSLTYGAPQTGTLRQVPILIAPESGTAAATMQAYALGYARLALAAAPGQHVAVRFGGIAPGTLVRLTRDSAPLAEATTNSMGEAGFIVEGDGAAATLEAHW